MPAEDALLGFALKGRMLSTYLPNTVLYAVVHSADRDGPGQHVRLRLLALSLSRA